MSRYRLQISRYSDGVYKDDSVMSAAAIVDELQAMESRIAELEIRDRLITSSLEGYQEENASLRFKLGNKKVTHLK